MNIHVLSDRGMFSSVSYDPLFELEDILAQTCNATILAPTFRGITFWNQQSLPTIAPLLNKAISHTMGMYEPIETIAESREAPNILLMVLPFAARLELLSSIPNWRQRFDVVAAYIFDAWAPESYPAIAQQLDHIFVPMPEIIDSIQAGWEVPVSLLPFASDVLNYGYGNADRAIDLISYGRIPPEHHLAFANTFNQPGSKRLYQRSIPRKARDYEVISPEDQLFQQDTQQLYSTLRNSKIALAYDTLYPGMRQFPHSFVTLRWFQCGAAGCAIVGKRPTTPLADQLLDWEDSTIELPDDPQECVQFIEALLQDTTRLSRIHQRNYLNNLAKHDWRHRIQTLLETLDLPLPSSLTQSIALLKSRHQQLSQQASQVRG